MATVYYNFDSLTVSPSSNKTQAITATQTNPVTNIQYNNIPYFISNMYFYKDTNANKFYFIVQTTSDPQSNTKCIFFAIPLKIETTSNETEIDKLFKASSSITINLSKCLTDGDTANIYNHTASGWNTVVVNTEYTIKSELENKTINLIDKLTLSGKSISVTIRKQIFGWNMDCTLLGEDEAGGEVNVPAVRVDTMDTMALLVMLLLVVSSFYLAVPIIYKYYIIPIARTHQNLPLASIDMYWTAISVLTIISLATYGIRSKQTSYYFFAFTVGLILVICKQWVRAHIGNIYTTNKAEVNVDFTANPKISNTPPGIAPGYLAVYTTSDGGTNWKAIISAFITLSSYLGINVAGAVSEDADAIYTRAIFGFIGMAIFTTSMFMDKIDMKILIFGIFMLLLATVPTAIFNVLDYASSKIQS
jgi:hypothetical protein